MDSSSLIYSSLLSQFSWLQHGFGTRDEPASTEAVFLKQIHSGIVLEAQKPDPPCLGEGDALVSNQPGITLDIRTADCYPVLLADAQNHAVAAIHAGWRGTAAQIVPAAISKMHLLYGSNPAHIFMAIGPGIGACCYAVGEEVAGQFNASCTQWRDGKLFLNLAVANHQQAAAAGIPDSQIETIGLCTFCEATQFYSYRREGQQAGRMHSRITVINTW